MAAPAKGNSADMACVQARQVKLVGFRSTCSIGFYCLLWLYRLDLP